MSDDVLLRFVTQNLINVGGDDTKLDKLREAAADLAEILKEEPTKTLAFALTAFDPEVPEKDPTISEAAAVLRGRWETYANTFAPTPVAVFRAMLMAALVQAARDNEAVAVGFVACARNLLPFMELGGEQEIWAIVVDEVERSVEERAEADWATPASIYLPKVKLTPISLDQSRVSGPKVNRNDLTNKLWAAAGPYYTEEDGQNHDTNGNEHWPDSNGHWVYEFGQRLAKAVCEAIDKTTENLSVENTGLSEATGNLAAAISTQLEATVKAVSGATAGLQRRVGLLWWKEALFSPSARKTYRELPAPAAAALMAFDLYRQIPAFSPVSVTAFLRETVATLPKLDGDRKAPIRALVEDAGQACILGELRTEAAKLVTAPVGRGPLLSLIGYPELLSKTDDCGFRDLVGVKPDSQLSLSDWSVWLLREFQAARTAVEASAARRKKTSRKLKRK